MKFKLYDLLTEDAQEHLHKYKSVWPEELEGLIEHNLYDTDGKDGTIYEIVFQVDDKFYRTYFTNYELAGFNDWTESMVHYKTGINFDYEIEADEVLRITKEVFSWVGK